MIPPDTCSSMPAAGWLTILAEQGKPGAVVNPVVRHMPKTPEPTVPWLTILSEQGKPGAVVNPMVRHMPKTPAEMDAEKKALRKQKNRESAAATRQRREEYTASLESQVSPCCWLLMCWANVLPSNLAF